jgi:hypothetical protein
VASGLMARGAISCPMCSDRCEEKWILNLKSCSTQLIHAVSQVLIPLQYCAQVLFGDNVKSVFHV